HPFDRAQRLLEVSQGAGEISSRHGGPAQALAGRPEPFRRAALLGRPKALPEGLLRFREAPARNEETTEIEEILDLLRAGAALPGQAERFHIRCFGLARPLEIEMERQPQVEKRVRKPRPIAQTLKGPDGFAEGGHGAHWISQVA